MGCLYERNCNHCKYLSEAVTIGVCEKTDHKLVKTGDGEFAEECELYENKWGYAERK